MLRLFGNVWRGKIQKIKQPNKIHNESKEKTCQMYICREKKDPHPLHILLLAAYPYFFNGLKRKLIHLAFLHCHVLVNVQYCFHNRLFILAYWFSQITAKGIYMREITFHGALWHFQLILS